MYTTHSAPQVSGLVSDPEVKQCKGSEKQKIQMRKTAGARARLTHLDMDWQGGSAHGVVVSHATDLVLANLFVPSLVCYITGQWCWYQFWNNTLASVPPQCSVVPNLFLFHQRIDMFMQTPLLSHFPLHILCLFLPISVLFSCHHMTQWRREQHSERYLSCRRLLRSPAMAEKRSGVILLQ